jgi:hypothetical protein
MLFPSGLLVPPKNRTNGLPAGKIPAEASAADHEPGF